MKTRLVQKVIGVLAVVIVTSVVLGCSFQSKGIDNSVGREVTLTGVAEPRKGGAAIRGDDFYVWLKEVNSWPENVVMKRIEVKGRLEVDYGLPVFIQQTNDPFPIQGIPVQEGTDLKKAARRYILVHPTWRLVE